MPAPTGTSSARRTTYGTRGPKDYQDMPYAFDDYDVVGEELLNVNDKYDVNQRKPEPEKRMVNGKQLLINNEIR